MAVQAGENLVLLHRGADAKTALSDHPFDERSDTDGSVFVEHDAGGNFDGLT